LGLPSLNLKMNFYIYITRVLETKGFLKTQEKHKYIPYPLWFKRQERRERLGRSRADINLLNEEEKLLVVFFN